MTNEQPTDAPEIPDSLAEGEAQEDEDELTKLRRQARHHKAERDRFAAEAKKNADAAKRLAEIEDSQKSEVEKLTEAQRAAEQRAIEAEQRAIRLEVAAAKGLTPAQAKRLIGTSVEELEADADDLLASFRAEEAANEPVADDRGLPRRPQERLRPGARPVAEPQMSAKEIVDRAEALSSL